MKWIKKNEAIYSGILHMGCDVVFEEEEMRWEGVVFDDEKICAIYTPKSE